MPMSIEHESGKQILRLTGDLPFGSAVELKNALLGAVGSGEELQVDLADAGEVDITLIQLLWAAEQQGLGGAVGLVRGASTTAIRAASDAGFERFPGFCDQDEAWRK